MLPYSRYHSLFERKSPQTLSWGLCYHPRQISMWVSYIRTHSFRIFRTLSHSSRCDRTINLLPHQHASYSSHMREARFDIADRQTLRGFWSALRPVYCVRIRHLLRLLHKHPHMDLPHRSYLHDNHFRSPLLFHIPLGHHPNHSQLASLGKPRLQPRSRSAKAQSASSSRSDIQRRYAFRFCDQKYLFMV